ncbi:MAG: nucleotidyl transferase AbiEii/AbiGii toxin family protein [Mycobacterium sp.]
MAEQVERDHFISHPLAFLGHEFSDRIHFIGGTALARTPLPDSRLSEDIDLTVLRDRVEVAHDLDAALPRAAARSHGRLIVEPPLGATVDTLPVLLRPAEARPVRLQLLLCWDRVLWPTERRALVQRYADVPPAELLVPTLPTFAASKTATWLDRRHGPTNKDPEVYLFRDAPSDACQWTAETARGRT